MSVFIIYASPNPNGVCAQCAAEMAGAFAANGLEVQTLQLQTASLQPCRCCGTGWGSCTHGQCVLDDAFETIYETMRDAEALVLITPVYWHDLAEPLKLLLDRVRRCDLRGGNHWLKGKKTLIAAVAKGTSNGIIHCLDNLGYTLNHLELDVRDRLPVTAFSRAYMLPALRGAAESLAALLRAEQ